MEEGLQESLEKYFGFFTLLLDMTISTWMPVDVAAMGRGQARASSTCESQGGHVEVTWILCDITVAELTYLEPLYMGSFAMWVNKSSFLLTPVVL